MNDNRELMPKGFEIVTKDSVIKKLYHRMEHYEEKGYYVGFNGLKDLYNMQKASCTDWTGFPVSGKTQFLMEVLINTSKWYGLRHLLYLPDVGTKEEVIGDLISKLTASTFNPQYENHITKAQIDRQIDWVMYHFLVIDKKDIKAKLTPYNFYDYAAKMQASEGIHTASIDSWKDLKHDYQKYGGYAQYLEDVLPYRNSLAESTGLHLHNIIHPKLTEKDKNGDRKPPTPYDNKGGSEWFNSGKCMITVHRPDPFGIDATITVHKAKPRSAGQIGICHLKYDLSKNIYYEHDDEIPGMERRYAAPEGDINTVPEPPEKPIKPNNLFDAR